MQILQAVKNFAIALQLQGHLENLQLQNGYKLKKKNYLQRRFYCKVVEKQKKKTKLFATVFASWVFQCELKKFIYNYFSVAKRLQNVKKKLQRPYEF